MFNQNAVGGGICQVICLGVGFSVVNVISILFYNSGGVLTMLHIRDRGFS